MSTQCRIATRQSALALQQSENVAARIQKHYPDWHVELYPLTSEGDNHTGRLQDLGGKSSFVRTLEHALLEGKADIAVHCLKDMPATLDEPFMFASYLEREDARDVLISNHSNELSKLSPGAVIGTASPRRYCQLRALRPDCSIKLLRGNVLRRLERLDAGDYDAIVLAAAGLKRLGLDHRIGSFLPFEGHLPAPGQGILAIECLQSQPHWKHALAFLNDDHSSAMAAAERATCRRLQASCYSPIAVHASLLNNQMTVRAMVGHKDGQQVHAVVNGSISRATELGFSIADELLDQGAKKWIHPVD